MRQVCNLVCAVQADALTEPGEYEKWENDINRPPLRYLGTGGSWRPRSTVSPELESLMRPAGIGA